MAELITEKMQHEDHPPTHIHYFTSESTSPSSTSISETYPPHTSYRLTVKHLSYSLNLHYNNIFTPLHNSVTTAFNWRTDDHCKDHDQSASSKLPLLRDISFSANSGEILAVVGPSGAGKSTLLRILAGRSDDAGEFNYESLLVNSNPVKNSYQLRRLCGFITQEDNLFPLLTVRETLIFSADFRLKDLTNKQKTQRVEALINELNLAHVADSFVGNADIRGISGGERKRVSIGVDVIHDPTVLLLDEPTTGLDSTSAVHVIEMLDSMARNRHRTIILTIHQPSYRILHHISSLVLLSNGSLAHHGSLSFLQQRIQNDLRQEIPIQLNPLEFAMEVIENLEQDHLQCSSNSYKTPTAMAVVDHEHDEAGTNKIYNSSNIHRPGHEVNIDQRFKMKLIAWRLYEILTLCARFWKIIYRTKQLFLARTMQAIIAGLGLGSVYLRIKKDENGVAERLGFFAFSLSFLLSSTVEALPIFLDERRVLMKEASRGAYNVSSYLIANTIVFLPFLFVLALLFSVPVYWLAGLNPQVGAFMWFVVIVWLILMMASSLVLFLSSVAPDYIAGNSLICMVLAAFFLFSGYFISKENIPKYWIFMYYVSLYKYPLDSLLVNEYWGMRGECFGRLNGTAGEDGLCLFNGRDVLKGRGLERDSRLENVGIMLGFFVLYRVVCWVVLARRAAKTKI